jgi:predicted metal-dependent peptidase
MKPTTEQVFEQAKEEFTHTMVRLIRHQPYFASFAMNMRKEFTTKFPTAGVSVTDTVNLYVNPFFFTSLTNEGKEALLIHEILHVANGHLIRAKGLAPEMFEAKDKTIKEVITDMKTHKLLNQTMDAAINEYIPNIPTNFKAFDKEGNVVVEPEEITDQQGNKVKNPKAGQPIVCNPVTVDKLREITGVKMENRQNFEYYYELLKREQQKRNGKGDSEGAGDTSDDHSAWAETSEDAEYVTEKVRQFVKKAMDDATIISTGNIPGELLAAIEWLNRQTRDWRKELQQIAARENEIKTEYSRKVRNRRYGILYPGSRHYPSLHIALLVDTSGSVHDEALQQIMVECNRMHELGAKITVIAGDTKVNDVFEFDPKRKINFTGRGGTIFRPLVEKAQEMNVDCIFFSTDGADCASDCPKPKGIPMYWLLYEGCEKHLQYEWGRRIEIKISDKKKK